MPKTTQMRRTFRLMGVPRRGIPKCDNVIDVVVPVYARPSTVPAHRPLRSAPSSRALLLLGAPLPQVPGSEVDLVQHLVRLLALLDFQVRDRSPNGDGLSLQAGVHFRVDGPEHGQR